MTKTNLYKNQYIFSSKRLTLNPPNLLRHQIASGFHIYHHESLPVEIIYKTSYHNFAFLLGYFIDPYYPNKSNIDILADIASQQNLNTLIKKLYSLTGRFVLLVGLNDAYYVFNDACGLRSCYYMFENSVFFATSHPNLFKLFRDITFKTEDVKKTYENFKNTRSEYSFPANAEVFNNINQLIPNHYINIKTKKQIRFWPKSNKKNLNYTEVFNKLHFLLKNSIKGASLRKKLILGLTAGLDSRTLLAVSDDIRNIETLTFKINNIGNKQDIIIAKKLSQSQNRKHHLIETDINVPENFYKLYQENVTYPHHQWQNIVFALTQSSINDGYFMKGNVIEIVRANNIIANLTFFKKRYKTNERFLLNHFHFIQNRHFLDFSKNWIRNLKNNNYYGYDLINLFVWEQVMPTWQANSLLEFDLFSESFLPYNNRELLEILLSLKLKYRLHPYNKIFNQLIKNNNSQLLNLDINETNKVKQFKHSVNYYLYCFIASL